MYDRYLFEKIIERFEKQLVNDNVYLPVSTTQFIDGLYCLYLNRPHTKFLEIGCGIGTKTILASLAGFKATGIELDSKYLDIAKKLDKEVEFIEADALSWDRYNEFDCIYQGGVFTDERQLELEDRILKQVQPSTFLFWPMSNRPLNFGWHQVEPGIWIY